MKTSPLIFFVIFVASCATTQHGDARQTGAPNQLGLLQLPEFSIGKTGTHTFNVSQLDRRAFPYKLRIESKNSRSSIRPYTGWEATLLKIEIVSDGKTLATTQFRPTRWRQLDLGKFEHIFWGPGQPGIAKLTNYQVRVTVLKPSRREWDRAKLVLR